MSSQRIKSLAKVSPEEEILFNVVRSLQRIQRDLRNSLPLAGLLPKNLGNSTKTEFVFRAHMGKGGAINTTAVKREDVNELESKEFADIPVETAEDKVITDALEAEFTREGN
jgi:hypothetical protein